MIPNLGVNPTQVDTTPIIAVGTETADTRRGFEGNVIRYVKAAELITAGNAVAHVDVTAGTVDETDAATDAIAGIAHVTIASGSYGWITVYGYVPDANVADLTTTAEGLIATTTAGRLDGGVTLAGKQCRALAAPSGNVADVFIF